MHSDLSSGFKATIPAKKKPASDDSGAGLAKPLKLLLESPIPSFVYRPDSVFDCPEVTFQILIWLVILPGPKPTDSTSNPRAS